MCHAVSLAKGRRSPEQRIYGFLIDLDLRLAGQVFNVPVVLLAKPSVLHLTLDRLIRTILSLYLPQAPDHSGSRVRVGEQCGFAWSKRQNRFRLLFIGKQLHYAVGVDLLVPLP